MTDKPHMTLPNGDKLYEDDYGRTRDGRKVGPVRKLQGLLDPWPFQIDDKYNAEWRGYSLTGRACNENGSNGMRPRCDIIAKWTESPAQPETGTLAELGVKPGDVVVLVAGKLGFESVGLTFTIDANGAACNSECGYFYPHLDDKYGRKWRIVSRASGTVQPEAPKLWRDMTPEEKGALLLAHHEGKVIQSNHTHEYNFNDWNDCEPEWCPDAAYRIRPETKRETRPLYYGGQFVPLVQIGTIDLIDGKPVIDSVKIEVGHV